MSYSLNSKVTYLGRVIGEHYGACKGDARNLDYSSSGLGRYAQRVSSSEANMSGLMFQEGREWRKSLQHEKPEGPRPRCAIV